MLTALIILASVGINNENPPIYPGKLKCLNPVRVNPKNEVSPADSIKNPPVDKCIAIPESSPKKPKRVGK